MGKAGLGADQTSQDPSKSLENLAESEQRFRKLVEALPDAIVVHTEGRIVFVNPSAIRLFGANQAQELVGREIVDFIHPDHRAIVKEKIDQCYASGEASAPLEIVAVSCDSLRLDVEGVAIPICWEGAPAIEVVVRDIRARKRAEEAARTWEKRLQLAQRAGLRIGLWDQDMSANTASWSDETCRQYGYTRQSFTGRLEDALERVHPDDRDRVLDAIGKVLNGGAEEFAEQYRVVHPDGAICWIDAQGVVVRNGSAHMIGVGVDITESKRAEHMLRDSEEKYRKLFENATYGIFLARPDGTLLEVNPAMVAMLGYASKAELLTRNLERDIYLDATDRKAILARVDCENRVEAVEANWKRADGRIIPVRMSEAAILGADAAISHYEVIVEDISEPRRLEEQYRQAQKMEAVGLLAGGISHDFNNLLGVILGNADLALEAVPMGSHRRCLETIKKAGGNAAQLLRQLLAFSRRQVLYPTVLNMNLIVQELEKSLLRLIGEDVSIKTDLEAQLGSIKADRGQVEQILMNLALNSRDAMPSGGTFRIITRNAELGPKDVARYSYVTPGSYIQLSVSDTGTGMSDEVRVRAFDPFFTTKEKGRATGLGLATVYGIVKQSGGYVWISSTVGRGTTVDIYLPRVKEKSPQQMPSFEPRARAARATATILLLEDDDLLREVTREMLLARGYNVLQAGSGKVAIELATQYKGAIPLIVSDVVLPEMSGPAAVLKLQALHPEMRPLFVSGYAEVPVTQQLIASGAALLQKPISREELLRKVEEMLQSGDTVLNGHGPER
jgi:two-component system, cell cycle sensor histidine kinase and response regulator CckA